MTKLKIDMETRSAVELKTHGVYVYAEDPSTDILCMAVKKDNERTGIWIPKTFKHLLILPEKRRDIQFFDSLTVASMVQHADEIHAHNAQFERVMWREVMQAKYGFPAIPLEKWRCTAAKAAYYALPRSLGDACAAMEVAQQKDTIGYKVMLKMCKPDSRGSWNEAPDDFLTLLHYCIQDVEAEHSFDESLPDIPESELEVYRMDQRINDRGVAVDLDSVQNLIYKVAEKQRRLFIEVAHITKGELRSTGQNQALKTWLANNGVVVEDLQKETVKTTLKGEITPEVQRMLEIRQSIAKSSVSKLEAMRRYACKDGRIRGTLLYHGASTGRWSGKGIQPQNFPRESFDAEEIEALVRLGVDEVDEKYGCTIQAASKCLRGMLWAGPGQTLFCADFSSIEARVLAWLANETKVLDAFRNNLDLYKVAAMDIYPVKYEDVTKEMRLIGKVCVLALGYQGWIGAFDSMAQVYGVRLEGEVTKGLPDKEAQEIRENKAKEIIVAWREAHPRITAYWKGVESAAMLAVQTDKVYSYGRIKFGTRGRFLHCRLPSGRLLSYCDPGIKKVKTKYGVQKDVISFMGVDSYTQRWSLQHTYGGKLTENIVQAVARDLLVEAIPRAADHGFPTVLHVHDEMVAEVPEGTGDLKGFEDLMAITPEWADGCPVGAEGWTGKRYRKN